MQRSGSSSSLLRRSGSSSCLLRPRSSLSVAELSELESFEPLSVTVVNTSLLPPYSAERYYILSELEVNARSVLFLCDYRPDGSHFDDRDDSPNRNGSGADIPPHAILYLLWRPETYPSARSFAEGPLTDSLRKLVELRGGDSAAAFDGAAVANGGGSAVSSERQPGTNVRVYVVVDRLSATPCPVPTDDDGADLDILEESEEEGGGGDEVATAVVEGSGDGTAASRPDIALRRQLSEDALSRHHAVETRISEDFTKFVSSSRVLRPLVEGVSVGTTSEVRAAPGLEVCLAIVGRGAAERRRAARELRSPFFWRRKSIGAAADGEESVEPSRSPVGVVAFHPDDLVGLDPEQEDHATQGILQSRTVTEWSGNGDYRCFADRAMKTWRERLGLEGAGVIEEGCDGYTEKTGGTGSHQRAGGRRKKVPRVRRVSRPDLEADVDSDDMATAAIVVTIVTFITYMWGRYGDVIREAVLR